MRRGLGGFWCTPRMGRGGVLLRTAGYTSAHYTQHTTLPHIYTLHTALYTLDTTHHTLHINTLLFDTLHALRNYTSHSRHHTLHSTHHMPHHTLHINILLSMYSTCFVHVLPAGRGIIILQACFWGWFGRFFPGVG